MFELNNFDAIKIGLASPEKIREWSRGEVKKPETINYRTLKPERDGLFCERIFGPTRDWECHCGKYKRVRYKGIICDRCGVEVTRSKVRRERMGHIELAAPVSHIWYFKGIPSRMGLLLDMSPRALEKVLYFASYVVIDPGSTPLSQKQVLNEKEYRESIEKFGSNFRAGMGAEAIKELLATMDLDTNANELREEIETSNGQKKIRAIKRLEVVEAFRLSGNKPEWMILDVVPVIPPELRPMVQLDGGRFATSDLNDLYRRVINRNNRLKRLLDLGAPEIIVRNEKRMLQEAVDALIDNGRRGRPVTGPGNRPLKSLSDMLKGKQGRFRQNLLGKRVDYSGRSVIVVGPELKIYQCGLPKEMALELFKPFVMKKLVEGGLAHNIKSAKRMVERVKPEVWDVLEEVIKGHPVLLNRAPTLHRLGIQAFEPVLVEGRAIKLHPLVCTAYNADFDGDQMAVHVPLSAEAQAEARILMLSANNLLKPQDGKPVTVPTQDMVLGSYYLTIEKKAEYDADGNVTNGVIGEGNSFCSPEEAIMAYQTNLLSLHARIKVKVKREVDGVMKSKIVETTVGKIIFNEAVPQNLGYVDRTNPETMFDFEVDFLVGKKELGKIIERCINVNGSNKTAEVLDKIKTLGFKYSTKGAVTIGVTDMTIPEVKQRYLDETDKKVDEIERHYKNGLYNRDERKRAIISAWNKTTEDIKNALIASLDRFNPVYMMSQSGARGNINQIRQLGGMRGLMADTSGETLEIPIRSNFREGLNVLEYFISTHGARKGLADTALRTADSGYLTRRLVDVAQEVIIREEDCGTDEGIDISPIVISGKTIERLAERLTGRYSSKEITDPNTGEVIVEENQLITEELAEKIEKAGYKKVSIRSVLTCCSRVGVCAKCYGINLANGEKCNAGEAVGFIAAQSIGEPGTQLTMRTFHTGGVAGEDITQGLPRVEELFEARKPKGLAIVSEIAGTVHIKESKKKREIEVVNNETGEVKTYLIPYGSSIKVMDGEEIEAGDELTEGSVNPHDILKIKGVQAVQRYLLQEVQKVYRLQGVDINDKHIEVIVRQMLRKVKIDDSGDTDMLPGSLVDMFEFEDKNKSAEEQGLRPATGKRALLGITKASLATESFLSAASFQETTRVLTEAAIKGKIDPLIGLKENIIIGKLIPAGTGLSKYRDIDVDINEVEVS
ncbi:MAG TPA: DNA-directed RNA polymerase subunit beta' [Clostridiaceae bacterium]|jgi:DNA-directed RNA polymerase subunit beta'|nr:DNA-directed RNA polymerase subunit beta' [Clostridiaceae bacterium]